MSLQPELKSRVLDLPPDQRAELARELILSLEDQQPDTDASAAWETEIERRLAAVDRGEVALLDWRESVARIRTGLNRHDSK